MELRPGRAGALVDSPDGVLLTGAPPAGAGHHRGDPRARRSELGVRGGVRRRPRRRGRHGRGRELRRQLPRGRPVRAVLERRGLRRSTTGTCCTRCASRSGRPATSSPSRRRTRGRSSPRASPSTSWPSREWSAGCSCPPETARRRGVVILGGSVGGPGGPVMGALLAGHGVPVLSLAYWGHPGTPDALRDIDVEVVARACDWLRAQDVGRRRAAVRGRPVPGRRAGPAGRVADARPRWARSPRSVGSGVPWGAWGPGTDVLETAWRFGGEPVPQMAEDEDDPDACIDDADMVAAAEIPVERADGAGAAAQRGGRRDVAQRPAQPDRRGARGARGRGASGSPTSRTPTPATSARRRRASR